MLNKLSSGTSARIAATHPAVARGGRASATVADEGADNDAYQPPSRDSGGTSAREPGGRAEARKEIDHAIANLLQEANQMQDMGGGRPIDPPSVKPVSIPNIEVEETAGAFDIHGRATGAYALRECIDKRETVLRPGAVYSADF